MRRVKLGRSGIDVSAIGYGCVALTTFSHEKDASALLHRAFDLGITHFDTARAYGAGFSEETLGRFIKGRRSQVTVATKFGLSPPAMVGTSQSVVRVVKRLLKAVPIVDRAVRRKLTEGTPAPRFTADACRESFERSLKALGTDHVDLLFLHNGSLSDACDEELAALAERLVADGKARAFGISAPVEYVGDDLDALPGPYATAQIDVDPRIAVIDWVSNQADRGVMTFGAMAHLPALRAAFTAANPLTKTRSERVGCDLADPVALVTLVLAAALDGNKHGGTLVGTKDPGHLRINAEAAARPITAQQCAAFRSICTDVLGPLR